MSLDYNELDKLKDDLLLKQEKHLSSSTLKTINETRDEVDNQIIKIIRYEIDQDSFMTKGQKDNLEKVLLSFTQDKKSKNFFLWNVYFIDVFKKNGGFDLVIANPPYRQLQADGGKLRKLYQNLNYDSFDSAGDLYLLFLELASFKSLVRLNEESIAKWIKMK